jgi:hypothetical protein
MVARPSMAARLAPVSINLDSMMSPSGRHSAAPRLECISVDRPGKKRAAGLRCRAHEAPARSCRPALEHARETRGDRRHGARPSASGCRSFRARAAPGRGVSRACCMALATIAAEPHVRPWRRCATRFAPRRGELRGPDHGSAEQSEHGSSSRALQERVDRVRAMARAQTIASAVCLPPSDVPQPRYLTPSELR